MFIFLNKAIKAYSRRNHKNKCSSFSSRGQIAILLIVVIAMVIIFTAIVLNMGRISQLKTTTIIASNQSAALLGSYMASYAESLYQTQLHGESGENPNAGDDLTICGWTLVAQIFLAIIIVALAFATGQIGLLTLIVSMAYYTIAVTLRLAILQPGMTDQWNKLWAEMETQDQLVEQGVIEALRNSIDDNFQLNDVADFDMDGLFTGDGMRGDKMNRFGFYYTMRLSTLYKRWRARTEPIKAFQNDLCDFLYEGTDVFGIFDPASPSHPIHTCPIWQGGPPMIRNPLDTGEAFCSIESNSAHPCCGTSPPSECNPCCLPDGVRPTCCDDGSCPRGNDASTCPTTGWPYVYDPLYENDDSGSIVSFLEGLGKDDGNPNLTNNIPTFGEGFRSDDATGIYPALWDIADRVNLNTVVDPLHPEMCFWCDERYENPPGVFPCATRPGLTLLEDCSGTECCMPAYADVVSNAMDINNDVQVPEDQCYDNAQDRPWWKKGTDMFCSSSYPYNWACPGRQCDETCSDPCGADGDPICLDQVGRASICSEDPDPTPYPGDPPDYREPRFWHEDNVDEVRYNMHRFISWAEEVLGAEPSQIARSFAMWYPEALQWIDPSQGFLADQIDSMQRWRDDVRSWRTTTQFIGDDVPLCIRNGTRTLLDIIDCYDALVSTTGTCGDVNRDGSINLGDPNYLLLYLSGGQPPFPYWTGNVNGSSDGIVDMNDAQYLINYISAGGLPPNCVDGNFTQMLRARRDFLVNARDQAIALENFLDNAIAEFNNFLNSDSIIDPENGLIAEYGKIKDEELDINLAPTVIYGWEDDGGRWHVVRVDSRLPSRCGGRCWRHQDGHEPGWPWIKTWTKSWGTRRCYALGDAFDRFADGTPNPICDEKDKWDDATSCYRGGLVGTRVIRYDEEKDLLLKFANNIPIWRFIFYHPDRGSAGRSGTDPGELFINTMVAECYNPDLYPDNIYSPGRESRAFMINRQQGGCFAAANAVLSRGVMTETCAEYFFHDASPRGFGVKFVACPDNRDIFQ